jgi:hypothetical protein
MKLQKICLHFTLFATVFLTANLAWAQDYIRRLRAPATPRGVIGGESHDSYVIRARRGQRMTVRISWRRERNELGDNHSEFWVGELPNFDGDGTVKFGKESHHGQRWSGKIPRTGDYYIYVLAHPIAHYTLRVTVK